MKYLFNVILGCVCILPLVACSDTPKCWDDKTKTALTELLQEKYGWDKITFSDIREIDSNFGARTCVVDVEYESTFSGMGALGMMFSQAMYGRKFTDGKEQIEYTIKIQQTEQYGKQAVVEITHIGDETEDEFNRYLNQLSKMPK